MWNVRFCLYAYGHPGKKRVRLITCLQHEWKLDSYMTAVPDTRQGDIVVFEAAPKLFENSHSCRSTYLGGSPVQSCPGGIFGIGKMLQ